MDCGVRSERRQPGSIRRVLHPLSGKRDWQDHELRGRVASIGVAPQEQKLLSQNTGDEGFFYFPDSREGIPRMQPVYKSFGTDKALPENILTAFERRTCYG